MEYLDIVDDCGIPTGETISREDAHRSGIRHRTSHVWLLRIHSGKLQVLLQKRSPDKDSYPGCLDISCAGHIPAGDNFIDSALRELMEELGVQAKADELIYCGQRQFEFREVFYGQKFWDNQISNIYALWRDMEAAAFTIQRSEIETVMWMDWDSCVQMVVNNETPNCIWVQELEMVYNTIDKNSK
jgi:isopentenyldiphosphate isomerase